MPRRKFETLTLEQREEALARLERVNPNGTVTREVWAAGIPIMQAVEITGRDHMTLRIWARLAGLHWTDGRKTPAVRAAKAAEVRSRFDNPEYRERALTILRTSENEAKRLRAVHDYYRNPANNRLAALTAAQRADYDMARSKGCLTDEAITIAGRPDLAGMRLGKGKAVPHTAEDLLLARMRAGIITQRKSA